MGVQAYLLEVDLAQATEAANARLEAMRRDFVANVSHELRTPLTIIRGYLHRLVNQAPDRSELQIQLSLVAEEVERLISISNKLLVLSQADAGRVSLEIQPIKLNDMVGEMVDDLQAQHQELTFSMDMPSGITFQGDNELIWQLTSNLFGNAVKYNRTGGVIRVTAGSRKDGVFITIANTGVAIHANKSLGRPAHAAANCRSVNTNRLAPMTCFWIGRN